MRIIKSVAAIHRVSRRLPRPLILVPTMGALHEAHLALVDHARHLAGPDGSTVVSIFVNPTQFGPREDFRKYPRPFDRDCSLLRTRKCDLVFAPAPAEMYAPDASVTVNESALSAVMCGTSRPGHFAGVCTVVTKLFNLVQPDSAVFGEKDFQQLVILRRMVRDLNIPVRIVGHPTIRESDGLALSSRNVYLSAEERTQAPLIQQTLREAELKIRTEAVRREALEKWMRRRIERGSLAEVDYVVAVDPETLQPREPTRLPVLLAAAVFFGATRLIDNLLVE